MVTNLDIGATLLEVAGATKPTDLQGESLLPLMKGTQAGEWRKSIYYHYYEYPGWQMVPKQYGVRTETHKLICLYNIYGNREYEMYDLVKDADEVNNIYGKYEYIQI